MATRRLPDAFQAELQSIPVAGTLLSISPTANGGVVSVGLVSNWLDARAGTGFKSVNDISSLTNIELKVQYDSFILVWTLNQVFLEFDINIPTNAIVYSAELNFQLNTTNNIGFVMEASTYDYGAALTISDFVPGANLLPGTKIGQFNVPPNQGFVGTLSFPFAVDHTATFVDQIIPGSKLRILLSFFLQKSTTAPNTFDSINATITKSSIRLNVNYVTAGQLIAALIGAYWGIKLTVQ